MQPPQGVPAALLRAPGPSQRPLMAGGADGMDDCVLYVAPVPPGLSSAHLTQLFGQFGKLAYVRVLEAKNTAFVGYEDPACAAAAKQAMDRVVTLPGQDRALEVRFARRRQAPQGLGIAKHQHHHQMQGNPLLWQQQQCMHHQQQMMMFAQHQQQIMGAHQGTAAPEQQQQQQYVPQQWQGYMQVPWGPGAAAAGDGSMQQHMVFPYPPGMWQQVPAPGGAKDGSGPVWCMYVPGPADPSAYMAHQQMPQQLQQQQQVPDGPVVYPVPPPNAGAAPMRATGPVWPAGGGRPILAPPPVNEALPPGCAPDAYKLFVGNVPITWMDHNVASLFASAGCAVVRADVLRDRLSHESKGCAFVWCRTAADADRAVAALDRHPVPDAWGAHGSAGGHRLAVRRAHPPRRGPRNGGGGGGSGGCAPLAGGLAAAAAAAGFVPGSGRRGAASSGDGTGSRDGSSGSGDGSSSTPIGTTSSGGMSLGAASVASHSKAHDAGGMATTGSSAGGDSAAVASANTSVGGAPAGQLAASVAPRAPSPATASAAALPQLLAQMNLARQRQQPQRGPGAASPLVSTAQPARSPLQGPPSPTRLGRMHAAGTDWQQQSPRRGSPARLPGHLRQQLPQQPKQQQASPYAQQMALPIVAGQQSAALQSAPAAGAGLSSAVAPPGPAWLNHALQHRHAQGHAHQKHGGGGAPPKGSPRQQAAAV